MQVLVLPTTSLGNLGISDDTFFVGFIAFPRYIFQHIPENKIVERQHGIPIIAPHNTPGPERGRLFQYASVFTLYY